MVTSGELALTTTATRKAPTSSAATAAASAAAVQARTANPGAMSGDHHAETAWKPVAASQ
jgi:hypothetical protein